MDTLTLSFVNLAAFACVAVAVASFLTAPIGVMLVYKRNHFESFDRYIYLI